jgi:rifampin ADP-ribosylating transferase
VSDGQIGSFGKREYEMAMTSTDFSAEELSEAQRALTSMLHKCQKSQEKLNQNSWQWGLMQSNIQALDTALVLISDSKSGFVIPRETLDQANQELFSTLQKVEKAQVKLAKGTAQATQAERRVAALRLAMALMAEQLAKTVDPGPFYHGTKANLKPGDLLEPGHSSNYGSHDTASFIYFSATIDAAIWGAELAAGVDRGRIYVVEPTSSFENDPNLTDTRYPGNPTRSYRTAAPLRVMGERADWEGHASEDIQAMLDGLEKLKHQGVEAINE